MFGLSQDEIIDAVLHRQFVPVHIIAKFKNNFIQNDNDKNKNNDNSDDKPQPVQFLTYSELIKLKEEYYNEMIQQYEELVKFEQNQAEKMKQNDKNFEEELIIDILKKFQTLEKLKSRNKQRRFDNILTELNQLDDKNKNNKDKKHINGNIDQNANKKMNELLGFMDDLHHEINSLKTQEEILTPQKHGYDSKYNDDLFNQDDFNAV
jgi:hypothetical protein